MFILNVKNGDAVNSIGPFPTEAGAEQYRARLAARYVTLYAPSCCEIVAADNEFCEFAQEVENADNSWLRRAH